MIDVNKIKKNMDIKKPKAEKGEITLDDKLQEYQTFIFLTDFLQDVVEYEENKNKNFSSILDKYTEDEDDVEVVSDIVMKMLRYVGVSESAIDDLIDDNDEISISELENLSELLAERVGDDDVYSFVVKALFDSTLDGVDEDSIQMDWSFSEKSKCTSDKGMKCVKGYSDGVKGYWGYPKDMVKDGKVKPSKHKGTEKKPKGFTKVNRMKPSARKKFEKSMNARRKAGKTTFGKQSENE